jgi:hypothetical protein
MNPARCHCATPQDEAFGDAGERRRLGRLKPLLGFHRGGEKPHQ